MGEEQLTAQQAASRLGMDVTAFVNMAMRSGIPYTRVGGHGLRRWSIEQLRYRPSDVEEFWEREQRRVRGYGVEP